MQGFVSFVTKQSANLKVTVPMPAEPANTSAIDPIICGTSRTGKKCVDYHYDLLHYSTYCLLSSLSPICAPTHTDLICGASITCNNYGYIDGYRYSHVDTCVAIRAYNHYTYRFHMWSEQNLQPICLYFFSQLHKRANLEVPFSMPKSPFLRPRP